MDYDHQDVKQHNTLNIPKKSPEASNTSIFAMNEQLQSKNPKIRYEASCELLKTLKETEVPDSYSMIIKLLTDTHPGVQEKALDSLLLLISKNSLELIESSLISTIVEKCGSSSRVSIKSKAIECLLNLTELSNTHVIIYDVLKDYLKEKKYSAKILVFVLEALTQLLHAFGDLVIPVSQVLQAAVDKASSTNVSVKKEAMKYLKEAQKWSKENFLEALADLKPIQKEELKKSFADDIKTPKPKRVINESKEPLLNKGENNSSSSARRKSIIEVRSKNSTVKIDVSSQITPKLISDLTDPSMKVRQAAKDSIEKILKSANNRIMPNGLSNLMIALKSRMNEPCKNLAKDFIVLVGNLVLALGPACKQYAKPLLQPLAWNLADKQPSIRNETLSSLNKFLEVIGIEPILETIGLVLEKNNPELRIEALRWILKNKESVKEVDTSYLVKTLIVVRQDKVKEIRELADDVIAIVIESTGYQLFFNSIQDLKPVVKNSLESVLEKYKPQINIPETIQSNKLVESRNNVIRKSKSIKSLTQRKKPPINHNAIYNQLPRTSSILLSPKKVRRPNKSSKSSANTTNASGSSKIEVIINGLGGKLKRVETSITWPIDKIREDYVISLKKNLKQVIHPSVFAFMFSVNPKENIEAFKLLTDAIKYDMSLVIDILDLLLKWITMRMIQCNPLIDKKIVEYLFVLFKELKEENYILMDYEAASILPILCKKLGTSNLKLKEDYKNLIRISFDIYSPSKIYTYLLEALKSKDIKIQSEALMFIKELLNLHEAKFVKAKDIKAFVDTASSNNNLIKNEAIECLVEIYKHLDERFWDLIERDSIDAKRCKEVLKSHFTLPIVLEEGLLEQEGEKVSSIKKCLELLKEEDMAQKLDGLISLDETLRSYVGEKIDVEVNDMYRVLVDVLKWMFNKEMQDIPLKFAKYFLNVFASICGIKNLLKSIQKPMLFIVLEELIQKLQYEKLKDLGTNSEGKAMLRSLETATMNLVSNSNPNIFFEVLIKLLKKNRLNSKIIALVVKTALSFCKEIEAFFSSLNVSKMLLIMHEYLAEVQLDMQNDEIIILKALLNELVKIKRGNIWEEYKSSVETHKTQDLHLKQWINLILESINYEDSPSLSKRQQSKT